MYLNKKHKQRVKKTTKKLRQQSLRVKRATGAILVAILLTALYLNHLSPEQRINTSLYEYTLTQSKQTNTVSSFLDLSGELGCFDGKEFQPIDQKLITRAFCNAQLAEKSEEAVIHLQQISWIANTDYIREIVMNHLQTNPSQVCIIDSELNCTSAQIVKYE